MTLGLVLVIARHGARVPLNTIPNDDSSYNCSHASVMGVVASVAQRAAAANGDGGGLGGSTPGGVSGAAILFRRLHATDKQHFGGNCARGQLTTHGYAQLLRAGARFRRRYVDELGFLPETLEPDTIAARTSMSERTMHSLHGFLSGLYPDGGPAGHLVDVEMLDERVENMYPRSSCRQFAVWWKGIKDAMNEQRKTQREALKTELLRIFKDNVPVAGRKVVSTSRAGLPSWEGLNNYVHCRLLNDIDMPLGFTRAHVDAVAREAYLDMRTKSATGEQQRLAIGRFLGDILQPIRRHAAQLDPHEPRAHLIFGHDNGMMPLVASLGLQDGLVPPMASAIVIEVHDRNAVRVFYRDQERRLPFCSAMPCPLAEFTAHVGALVPDDYEAACKAEEPLNYEAVARDLQHELAEIEAARDAAEVGR